MLDIGRAEAGRVQRQRGLSGTGGSAVQWHRQSRSCLCLNSSALLACSRLSRRSSVAKPVRRRKMRPNRLPNAGALCGRGVIRQALRSARRSQTSPRTWAGTAAVSGPCVHRGRTAFPLAARGGAGSQRAVSSRGRVMRPCGGGGLPVVPGLQSRCLRPPPTRGRAAGSELAAPTAAPDP